MEHSQQLDLNDKYNDGVVPLSEASSAEIPLLDTPAYHPSPEQVNQAREQLLISTILLVLAGLLFVLLLGLALIFLVG